MPYRVEWLVEERVLLSTFSGVVTEVELKQFIREISTEIERGKLLVHHISNSLAMEKVQFSLKSLQIMVSAYKIAGKLTWQIDINRHPMNKMFANLATQFVKVRTRTFPTLQEAIDFLQQHDPTLADATWNTTEQLASQTRPVKPPASTVS